MKGQYSNLKILVVFIFVFGLAQSAQAKKKQKNGHLVISIKKAMDRSDQDQDSIRDQINSEAERRVEAWRQRKMDAIEIKYTGTSSIEPVDLGAPDLSLEELGEDHSGLTDLHSEVDEESTDIDFDEELREVSSMKD